MCDYGTYAPPTTTAVVITATCWRWQRPRFRDIAWHFGVGVITTRAPLFDSFLRKGYSFMLDGMPHDIRRAERFMESKGFTRVDA